LEGRIEDAKPEVLHDLVRQGLIRPV